jgi:hypothetical protein
MYRRPSEPHVPAFAALLLAAALPMAGCAPLLGGTYATAQDLDAILARCESHHAALITENQSLHDGLSALQASVDRVARDVADTGCATAGAAATPAPPEPAGVSAAQPPAGKLVVGEMERVWIEELQLALPARVDTGAETASLDARDITPFERDGKAWISFRIPHPTDPDQMLSLERPKVREALILQASSETPERRFVIELGIRLGDIRQLAEFTLSDRSHLEYQMLVGRNILRDVMLVDVSARNLVPPPVPRQP